MGGLMSYFLGGPTVDSATLDIPDKMTGLTPRQRQFVTDTWALVKKDIRGNGIELFMRFFEMRPEAKNRFRSFADIPMEQLRDSKRLQAHTNSVMYAIDSVVENLDDPECLVEMLHKMGENHGRRKITEQEFLDLKTVLMKLLKDKLDIHLTTDGEQAWSMTVDVAYKFIFEGMQSPP